MAEIGTFWERVEYAIQRAAAAAKDLPLPFEQELIIWQESAHRTVNGQFYYFVTTKAAWISQVKTCFLMDERNY